MSSTNLFLLIPPLMCYFASAVFLLSSQPVFLRAALLPVTLFTAFRACAVDVASMIAGYTGHEFRQLSELNQGLAIVMTGISLRCILWTFSDSKLFRLKNAQAQAQTTVTTKAFSLCWSLRGSQWMFSRGLHVPPSPSWLYKSPRSLFVLASFALGFLHYSIVDFFHTIAQRHQAPNTPINGVFDPSLPILQQYTNALICTFSLGMIIHTVLLADSHILASFAVAFLGHSPNDWPPLAESPLVGAPWLRTMSLNQLWSKQWHQLFRDVFIGVGYSPFASLPVVGSDALGVLSAFSISGILHCIGLYAMKGSEEGDWIWMFTFFFMQGVGCILERLLFSPSTPNSKANGKVKENGIGKKSRMGLGELVLRKIWITTWVLGWAIPMTHVWSKAGMIDSVFFPEYFRPGRWVVDTAVRAFGSLVQ